MSRLLGFASVSSSILFFVLGAAVIAEAQPTLVSQDCPIQVQVSGAAGKVIITDGIGERTFTADFRAEQFSVAPQENAAIMPVYRTWHTEPGLIVINKVRYRIDSETGLAQSFLNAAVEVLLWTDQGRQWYVVVARNQHNDPLFSLFGNSETDEIICTGNTPQSGGTIPSFFQPFVSQLTQKTVVNTIDVDRFEELIERHNDKLLEAEASEEASAFSATQADSCAGREAALSDLADQLQTQNDSLNTSYATCDDENSRLRSVARKAYEDRDAALADRDDALNKARWAQGVGNIVLKGLQRVAKKISRGDLKSAIKVLTKTIRKAKRAIKNKA